MSDYIDTTFEFEGNTFPLRILTGMVIDTQARSDTHVSGGGSYRSGNNLHVSAVTSHVEITQNLWLQCASGKERDLQFKTDFPVRPGHILQIAFLVGYDDENMAWLGFDNTTTDKGWTTTRTYLNAQTTNKRIISLCPLHSSWAYFYLVKCLYIPAILGALVLFFNLSGHRGGVGDVISAIVFSYPVVVFFGFLYRTSPASRKQLSEPFKNAAIAKFNGMTTQRAEAVEQLKASLAGVATSETATISGTPQQLLTQ